MRTRERDRQARLREFYETLPPTQQGVVISVLLAYASVAVTAEGALGIAVLRGIRRGWQERRLGPVAAVRAGVVPALSMALVLAAAHWVVAEWLIRAIETGRAQAWLDQQERWLADRQVSERAS